jgi:hypothetical protein
MKKRAARSGIQLNEHDASIVKGMLRRGDRQHDIAAWFGVNGGRIAEIASNRTFANVFEADSSDLPPPGPYPALRDAARVAMSIRQAKDLLAKAEAKLSAFGAR